jgi:predicted adenylyl cyclase CyaB
MAQTRMPRAADYLGSAPMPRNVEIKAYIESVDLLARKTAAIADQGPIEIDQDDTFFYCEAGRLKLRVLSVEEGELIFYRRPDQHGPKESYYLRSLTSTPETLRELLTQAYGQAARVQKHRTLFLVGRTRVHLDHVKFLGDFLEIEVVLEEGEPVEAGVGEARRVMARLGIEPEQLIEGAYVDLLAQQGVCNQCAAQDQDGPGT